MTLTGKHRRIAYYCALVGMTISLVGLAVAASALATIRVTQAAPLPPGAAAAGPISINPTSGDSGTTFALEFPAASYCPGDNPAGYYWTAFITPASQDIATLTFGASGSPIGPAFTSTLRKTGGDLIRAQNPGLTDGIVNPPGFATFELQAVPAGAYKVGIACYKDGLPETYWATPITVTAMVGAGPQNFNWAYGAVPAVPAAPVLASPLTVGATTLAGSFTAAASDPATTGYTVTVTPTAPAGAARTFPVTAAGAFTLTGLTTGTTYAVTVTATNSVGPSLPSNTVSGTPSVGVQPLIPLGLTAGTGQITATFQAPGAPAPVPTGYTLTVTPAPGGTTPASFTFGAGIGPFTQVVPNLAPSTTYTFTLTPAYAAPDSGTPTTKTATLPKASSTTTTSTTPTTSITTTLVGPTTTTTVLGGSAASGGSPSAGASSSGTLPGTGASPMGLAVWAVLLVVFGRMAVLLGRKPKVL